MTIKISAPTITKCLKPKEKLNLEGSIKNTLPSNLPGKNNLPKSLKMNSVHHHLTKMMKLVQGVSPRKTRKLKFILSKKMRVLI